MRGMHICRCLADAPLQCAAAGRIGETLRFPIRNLRGCPSDTSLFTAFFRSFPRLRPTPYRHSPLAERFPFPYIGPFRNASRDQGTPQTGGVTSKGGDTP